MKKRIISAILVFVIIASITPTAFARVVDYTVYDDYIEVRIDISGEDNIIRSDLERVLFEQSLYYIRFFTLWATEPEFRNNNATGDRVTTNRALYNAVSDFWRDYSSRIPDRVQAIGCFGPTSADVDVELSDKFRRVLIDGWRDESLATVMPFNQAWFEEVIGGVEFVFTREAQDVGLRTDFRGGFYMSGVPKSLVYISDSRQGRARFVHVAIHEVLHALGLGESLTMLLERELGTNSNEAFLVGGDFDYNPTFCRTLLRHMESLGRTDEFWEAAFHSNAAYRRLWDEHMSQYIGFERLRQLMGFAVLEPDHVIVERIQGVGLTQRAAERDVLRAWNILHGGRPPTSEREAYALEILQNLSDNMYAVQGVHSYLSLGAPLAILDFAIANHNHRNNPAVEFVGLPLSIIIEDGITRLSVGFNYGDRFFSRLFFEDIIKMSIPNSVTEIGENALSHFAGLETVILPESLTKIGARAFYRTGLTSATIPESVTYIGSGAFSSSDLVSVSIPEGITRIGNSVFAGCAYLENVTIPYGVTEIGLHSFFENISLESITLPESLETIKRGAFRNSGNLRSIIIPPSVTYIGDMAFDGTSPDLTIYGYAGSVAEEFALSNDINFVDMNPPEPEPLPAPLPEQAGEPANESTEPEQNQPSTASADDGFPLWLIIPIAAGGVGVGAVLAVVIGNRKRVR